MSVIKRDRYVDESQYVRNKKGNISWTDMIGKPIEFFIDGERYEYKILAARKQKADILLNNELLLKDVHISGMKNLYFGKKYKFKPKFLYNIGDVLGNKLGDFQIIEQIVDEKIDWKGRPYQYKKYKCKCLRDGCEWIMPEYDIKKDRGCPACGHKLRSGINDVTITRPDLLKYFKNPEDANHVMAGAATRILFKCPVCGYEKEQRMVEVSSEGFSCPMCGDGISFPNKFARNLFKQLSDQYVYYTYEWSPEWAGKYLYDNYIELKDGRKVVVEMDGGFHYGTKLFNGTNDVIKDKLAKEHNVQMIRVECNYRKSSERFEYVKSSIIFALGDVFDLSSVDWDEIYNQATTNLMAEVIEEYNKDITVPFKDIAKKFGISGGTVGNYVKQGARLGLCVYNGSQIKPIVATNINSGVVSIFDSAEEFAVFVGYIPRSKSNVAEAAREHKQIKDYMLRYMTPEEYKNYLIQKQAV